MSNIKKIEAILETYGLPKEAKDEIFSEVYDLVDQAYMEGLNDKEAELWSWYTENDWYAEND